MAHIKRSQIRQLVREMVRSTLKEQVPGPAGSVPQQLVDRIVGQQSWMNRKRKQVARPWHSDGHMLSFTWSNGSRPRDGSVTNIETTEWDPDICDPICSRDPYEGNASLPNTTKREVEREVKQAIVDFLSHDRGTMSNGRYTIRYSVLPNQWPDDDDPYCGGIGQRDCDDPGYIPRGGQTDLEKYISFRV